MTITTENCKEFIDEIANQLGASGDTWKRIKKYKEGFLTLRDFQNQNGRTLTLAENNETLFLYSLQTSVDMISQEVVDIKNELGHKYIGHPATEQDVFKFISDCAKEDNSIVDEEDVHDAVDASSWTVWMKWSNKGNNDYDNFSLKDYFEESGNWGEFDLHYSDNDGTKWQVVPSEIVQVFWVGMRDYDTAYRIYIFETKDHHLMLGINNPD